MGAPALVVALVAALLARRPPLRPSGYAVGPAVAIVAAGLIVSAAAWLVPGDDYPARYTDILWHEGWIRQLVGGGNAPGGVYADVPNAYPWLEHALAALVMSAGGLAMTPTLIAVEAVMLLALGTGTWLLAVELELEPAAAAWAAVLATAGGGIGWLAAGGPAAVLTASRADPSTTPADLLRFQRGIGHYGGDLLLSPAPTPALGNIPPAMPRELGLALVPLAAWAAVRAAHRSAPRWWALAGAAAGLAFLASPVAGIVAAFTGLAVAAAHRSRAAWVAIPPMIGVTGVWLGPLAWHTADLGGLVNTTRGRPIEPTAAQALVAIAVLVVLGAVGAVLAARSRAIDRRALAAVTAGLIAPALAAAAAPGLDAVPALTRAAPLPPGRRARPRAPGRPRGGLARRAGAGEGADPRRGGDRGRRDGLGRDGLGGHGRGAPPTAASIRCFGATSPLGGSGGGTIAVVGSPNGPAPSDPLALTVFARTGAPLLYISRPRIRFPDIFLHIPAQAPRFFALRAIDVGRPAPADVTRVLAPATDAAPPGFVAAGSCQVGTVVDGSYRTLPYRWYVRG